MDDQAAGNFVDRGIFVEDGADGLGDFGAAIGAFDAVEMERGWATARVVQRRRRASRMGRAPC